MEELIWAIEIPSNLKNINYILKEVSMFKKYSSIYKPKN